MVVAKGLATTLMEPSTLSVSHDTTTLPSEVDLMTFSTPKALVAALALALLSTLPSAGAALRAAETGTFPIQETFSETVDFSGTCLGTSAIATITGTATGAGHFTENGPPAFGFHDHGTVTTDFRASFTDGRFALGTEVSHFNDNATHSDQFTSTTTARSSSTLYDAAGQSVGRVVIHHLFHVTFRDANGNHQPDPGEFAVNIDRFRVTCR
jgi:hypothetical protein